MELQGHFRNNSLCVKRWIGLSGSRVTESLLSSVFPEGRLAGPGPQQLPAAEGPERPGVEDGAQSSPRPQRTQTGSAGTGRNVCLGQLRSVQRLALQGRLPRALCVSWGHQRDPKKQAMKHVHADFREGWSGQRGLGGEPRIGTAFRT